jgi:hypothetical protein
MITQAIQAHYTFFKTSLPGFVGGSDDHCLFTRRQNDCPIIPIIRINSGTWIVATAMVLCYIILNSVVALKQNLFLPYWGHIGSVLHCIASVQLWMVLYVEWKRY